MGVRCCSCTASSAPRFSSRGTSRRSRSAFECLQSTSARMAIREVPPTHRTVAPHSGARGSFGAAVIRGRHFVRFSGESASSRLRWVGGSVIWFVMW